ncbi:hypothetical protein [Haploplasma axanthum]|uniref:Uncharacterized protein n=1 Tax=Haploplasma axanthum TaxID=29552 RepID=A0A449BEG9_HAPAX|nr:hypothetical protein [Haploplasma axanthum]VEU80849.1 Uncharacterised protein [Haploplasma axanthum]
MRKFKYPFQKRINKKLLRKRIMLLDEEKRKKYKAYILFRNLLSVLFVVVVFILLIVMAIFSEKIGRAIGKFFTAVVTLLITFIVPGVFVIFIYLKLENNYSYQSLGNIPRKTIQECNKSLMKFYKVSSNYIITKCYNSSNDFLTNKDVILFFYKSKLRIINDLHLQQKILDVMNFELMK